jgi:putative ABC transport system permease protein
MLEWLRIAVSRANSVLHRGRVDQEFQEELDSHFQHLTEDNLRRGMTLAEAQRAARLRLGGATQLREINRDLHGFPFFDRLFQDLRYAARMLRKNPGFTAITVVTLALGIGANTAMFSVVYAVLLRPLPYVQPERLMHVGIQWPTGYTNDNITPALAEAVVARARSFESVALQFPSTGCNLAGAGSPEFVPDQRVSASFLHTLGVQPIIGRDLVEADATGAPAALVSYRLWRAHFGADDHVLGRTVWCNGQAYSVVGVLPRHFRFVRPSDIWLPDRLIAHTTDQGMNYTLVGRLRDGVSREAAAGELANIFRQVKNERPNAFTSRATGFGLHMMQEWTSAELKKPLWLLLGAVVLVLLIACANVAGLLLARASVRTQEIGIRLALGASTWRVVRQLLTETLVFTALGASLGLLLAWWSLGILKIVIPAHVGIFSAAAIDVSSIEINGPVLWFTAGLAIAAAMIAGVVPAWTASSSNLHTTLRIARTTWTTPGQQRSRKLLVGAEMALAIVLLICAALLMRSFAALQAVDLGFQPNNLQVAEISLSSRQYATSQAVWSFDQKVISRVRALPGVASAAFVSSPPLQPGLNLGSPVIDGKECPAGAVDYRAVTPGFFQTMGIRFTAGRDFTDSDVPGSPAVIIVNEPAARTCWGHANPIGTQFWTWVVSHDKSPLEVVGIVRDVHEYSVDQPAPPIIYVPQAQVNDEFNDLLYQSFGMLSAIVIRSNGPRDLGLGVRQAVESVDPKQPIASVAPMTALVAQSTAFSRMLMLLISTFAGLALALTIIGLYGMLSYHVAQRTHEIGVRVALGADRRDVVALVLSQGMKIALVGIGIGLMVAFAVTRVMSHLLFAVNARDPLTFAGVAALLAVVALGASYLPARRATEVDPMVALRAD